MDEILARLEALERTCAASRDRDAIENLFSAYQSAFTAVEGDAIVQRFWADRKDISLEIGASGVYEGSRGVSSYYQKDRLPGDLTVYTLSSPCIEIAGDGQSARGLWTSSGIETSAGDFSPQPPQGLEARALLTSVTADGRQYKAEWIWQKFAVDFIRQADGWRIWHLHACELMRCPFDQDWVRFSLQRFATDGLRIDAQFTSNIPFPPGVPPENNATRATTFHWQYQPGALPQLAPKPPEPYEAFSGE